MVNFGVRRFADAEEYSHSVQAAQVEGFIPERGQFHAELNRVTFDRLWMQAGSESVGRVCRVNVAHKRRAIYFLTDSQQANTIQDGRELTPDELALLNPDDIHHHRTSSSSRWASMSLPAAYLDTVAETVTGRCLPLPPSANVIRPAAPMLAKLRSLHAGLTNIVRTRPAALDHAEIARGLEQDLLRALIYCLSAGDAFVTSRAVRNHRQIMVRFASWLEANLGRPVYLTEACAALGISERTLRICCHEQFGMSPIRYLFLRRMQLSNRSLSDAEPGTTTVAAIATEYGFWELGRFSVAYKELFGESPSVTLNKQASRRTAFAEFA